MLEQKVTFQIDCDTLYNTVALIDMLNLSFIRLQYLNFVILYMTLILLT